MYFKLDATMAWTCQTPFCFNASQQHHQLQKCKACIDQSEHSNYNELKEYKVNHKILPKSARVSKISLTNTPKA